MASSSSSPSLLVLQVGTEAQMQLGCSVSADGALLVRDASGVLQSITSAEVSVRPHPHAPGA